MVQNDRGLTENVLNYKKLTSKKFRKIENFKGGTLDKNYGKIDFAENVWKCELWLVIAQQYVKTRK